MSNIKMDYVFVFTFVSNMLARHKSLNWKVILQPEGKLIQNLLSRIWDNWDHPVEVNKIFL